MRSVLCVAVIVPLIVFAKPALAGNKDFSAQFNQCEEFVGVGSMPATRARSLVPSQYVLAGDGANALLVLRVTSCAQVSVDGKPAQAARTAQIGVVLQVPVPNADIENYMLWFATDSGNLHGKLNAAGFKSSNGQQLKLTWQPSGGQGPLQIETSAPKFPALSLRGNAQTPSDPALGFIANWVADGKHGTLLMRTGFQALRFGSASVVLSVPAGAELAQLIGATSLTFGVLNSYNTWTTANMQVTLP